MLKKYLLFIIYELYFFLGLYCADAAHNFQNSQIFEHLEDFGEKEILNKGPLTQLDVDLIEFYTLDHKVA